MMYRSSPSPAGTCPRCREALLGVPEADGVRWCEKCGGVFANLAASRRAVNAVDRVLLEIGFQASMGRPRKLDEGRKITCPECQIEMQRVRIEAANCFIDACPLHGTWFDSGELADVMRAYARARRHGTVPHPSESTGEDLPTPELSPHELEALRDMFVASSND